MAEFITFRLKGESLARNIFQALGQRLGLIVLKPTFEWLEDELTEDFEELIGPGSSTYYKGDLWNLLGSEIKKDRLIFTEGGFHGGFVRRGTRPYHGTSARIGGYKRLKAWAESKLGLQPSAASRVAWFTLAGGTRSSKSDVYPLGSRRFDYPLKVVEVTGKDTLQQVADQLGKVVINYIESKQAGLG